MKKHLSGARAIGAATAAFALAIVVVPLASSPAGADTVPASPGPAALSVTSSSTTASYAAVNSTISFTYVVTNTGGTSLDDVAVRGVLAAPAGASSLPACQSVTGGGSCTSGDAASLPPGTAATFSAIYAASQKDLDNGAVAGSATATGAPPSGGMVSATANTTSVPAAQRPGITLATSASVPGSPDGRSAGAGGVIDYSYLIGNSGNVTLDPVTLADAVSGLSATSCPDVSLSPGVTEACTASKITTASDVAAGSITDAATATGTPPHGGNVAATSSVSVPAAKTPSSAGAKTATVNAGPTSSSSPAGMNGEAQSQNQGLGELARGQQGQQGQPAGGQHPSISLKKTATVAGSSDGRYSAAGQTVDYSYRIKNTGNVVLNPVTLADPMPGLLGLSCPDTALFPGLSEVCTADYTTTLADVDAGSITNTATSTGTPTCGGPNVSATSSATVYAEQQPSISLKKTAMVVGSTDGRYSAPGQTVEYSYRIQNTGNVVLNPVTLDDPMPGLADLRCPHTALFPGIGETCTASYTTTQADVDAGSITNTATATGTPSCGPKVWATSSTTVYGAPAPAISLTKTATVVGSTDGRYSAPGQTIDYSYLVTNSGNVTLNPVTLEDPKPGLRDLSCPQTALAPGASETCTSNYTTTLADVDAGSITNTATATGTPPCGPNVTATSTATVYGKQSPAISVVKTADVPAVSAVGQSVLYTFAVTNTGNVTLHNVDVTDAQASPSLGSSVGPITCTSGTNGSITLAPGASETCSATYTVTQADLSNGSVTDTATATGFPPCGPPVTGTSTLTLPVTQISVSKAVNLTTIVAGSMAPIVYTITVTNSGTATTTDPITVNDAAPAGTTLVSGSPACATGGPPACSVSTSGAAIRWTIAAGVAPGSAYTLTYSVTLRASEVGGDIVTNTATWSGPSCGPPATTCSSNTVTTTVTAPPVTKPATTPPAAVVSAPPPSPPSAPVIVAFTGAFLSQEVVIGLAALALGSTMVAVSRRRRRAPKGATK